MRRPGARTGAGDGPRCSRAVRIGAVRVGGGAPVSIQTMAKADPRDTERIVRQLRAARAAGCDIARVAVPDLTAARSISRIRERTGLPIVADVHFDHRLAIEAARCGADGLRVNPGNLGGPRAVRAVAEAARAAGIPIRVGVNAGSLPKRAGRPVAASVSAVVRAALDMANEFFRCEFFELKVSLKAFDVPLTIAANRAFAAASDLPIHLGLTEAGPPLSGAVRSAAALAPLLLEGIGDTVRISLSGSPAEEVRAARTLLVCLGLRKGGAVVSCPTCGRTSAEVVPVARRVEHFLEESGLSLVVAVMGCEVNGPGEARAADVGIAFGPRGRGLLFEGGVVVESAPNRELERLLMCRLRQAAEARHG
ncbi:MAG: flavodoxin-dependent (E)-4-hydroxy-3-methylbut-2-enyl-diphosphate synthase [Myxococcales bacterium]|nr:flavodoxin-dependent (E)-4-hydroxy-3-methylbut-2-enyl-diphosphate synthase [Myxococcales bacterium]